MTIEAIAPAEDGPAPIVHIVDDDASVRAGLEDLLASVGIGCRAFASTQAFLAHALPEAPGCLVLDVRMPGQSGLDFQRHMLTNGEREVMELVAQGLLNKQIAARLEVSEVTVKVRRGQVMRKMNARSLPDLVRIHDRLFPPSE